MFDPIVVITVRGLRPSAKVEYVGRSWAGWKGSVLANPFVIGKDGTREIVIAKYKKWLWKEMRSGRGSVWAECARLANKVQAGEQIALGCWCSPLPCHAEVIRSAILWMIEQNPKNPTQERSSQS